MYEHGITINKKEAVHLKEQGGVCGRVGKEEGRNDVIIISKMKGVFKATEVSVM